MTAQPSPLPPEPQPVRGATTNLTPRRWWFYARAYPVSGAYTFGPSNRKGAKPKDGATQDAPAAEPPK